MSSVVHVHGISPETSEKEVSDFFSFCGKIQSISVTPTATGPKSATVTFEKETAAKTALLLDNTQLGPSQVSVSAAASLDEIAPGKVTGAADESEELHQEDKPHSRIIAECLAHGYMVSDGAVERALKLDEQHGISSRFTKALTDFDNKYKASSKAAELDQKYGVSQKATAGWHGLNSYFDKALDNPTGHKLRAFYQNGNKTIYDVHNEARHLANLKSGKQNITPVGPSSEKTTCSCSADPNECPCVNCACAGCPKNHAEPNPKTDAFTEKPPVA